MKNILLFVLLIFVAPQIAFSQTSNKSGVSARINVSAEVVQTIELITVNTMQFENVAPQNGVIYINPINNSNAGYMIAAGTPEANFRLNFLPQIDLTQVEGDYTLNFTYEISVNDIDNQSTSVLIENENQSLQFNDEGRCYIWIGGRVPIENAAPGNYEGDFTIEIDYI